MTDEPAKAPMGRPSDYTVEIADRICARLADGTSLRTICLSEDMPDRTTVYRWLRTNEDFRNQYACAKEDSADALMEDILDIADDGTNDWMTVRDQKTGEEYQILNKEHVARSKLRVESRKWAASKLKPKKYGDTALIKNQLLDRKGDPTDPVSNDAAVVAAAELFNKFFSEADKPNDPV